MTETPADLLAHVHRAARHTRAAAWSAWFPLVVFGVLVLASAWLYRDPYSIVGLPEHSAIYTLDSLTFADRFNVFAGGGTPRPEASIYWAIAAPLGYALCAWWYARHGRRAGVVPPWPAYVAPGLALVAVTALAVALPLSWPEIPGLRFLSPLTAVGLGFVVLGLLHRSPALVGFATAWTAFAALVTGTVLQDLGSTAAWNSPFVTVGTLGLVAVAAGLAARVTQHRGAS